MKLIVPGDAAQILNPLLRARDFVFQVKPTSAKSQCTNELYREPIVWDKWGR
ncbi:hypothetical protein M378DRAFT_163234 [Amanita muscaria Koide BX008]|uniref:Uncharacterized protein n=1 Tax=Amanita muscaria (strain Koide BX008) TaxID=946122 RepID=A0A0C2TCB7_AMAMK|nr:hypothetical protein M378DRAFT_163234 [Amanita muscaria Koide BX008]